MLRANVRITCVGVMLRNVKYNEATSLTRVGWCKGRRRARRIMEDEDLEETNNEDCGQRARRLATLRKRRQREKDKIESRPIQQVHPCILRIMCIYVPCCTAP